MLHIILLILKIIGIALLIIIGLLLLVLLTVLLVPIRYRATAAHGETLTADVKVSWLLHIIEARVTYLEGKLKIRVRLLWIMLYDNLMPKETKAKKKSKKARVKTKKISGEKIKKKSYRNKPKVLPEVKKEVEPEIKTELPSEIKKDTNQDIKPELKPEIQKVIKSELKPEITPELRTEIKSEFVSEGKSEIKTDTKLDFEDDISIDKEKKIPLVKRLFYQIRNIVTKIKHLKDRIIGFFTGIRRKIIKLLDNFRNIKQKYRLITDFIRDEYNKEGFRVTYHSLKKFLKHILPTKLRSRIVFGTGDPCSTGQALGALSILYSFYGDRIVIVPDFEKKRLEGEHFAVGRIRPVTVLIIILKLILDKRFKQLRNSFQILKEAL